MTGARKGLSKKESEEDNLPKIVVVDSEIDDYEIVWASVHIRAKKGIDEMTFIPYTRRRHDASIDYALKRVKLSDSDPLRIEVKKIKRLGKSMIIVPEQIKKWIIKKE